MSCGHRNVSWYDSDLDVDLLEEIRDHPDTPFTVSGMCEDCLTEVRITWKPSEPEVSS